MKEKDYYDISEIWDLFEQVKEEIGAEELAENMARYFGSVELLEALKSIATDFDLWDYEED